MRKFVISSKLGAESFRVLGNMRSRGFCLLFFALIVLPLVAVSAYADTIVLGSAASYAVLGASGVTNSGVTTINGGNLGSFPTNSLTGTTLCPGANCITITGGTIGTATATNQTDLAKAISGLQGLSSFSLGPGGLAGVLTVTPGVYSSGSTFDLNGKLTLDAQNKSNVDFIFLVGSSLTAETGSVVNLINADSTDGVYWVETGSASLLSGATFVGNILASTSITIGSGVTITCGSALAHTGNVTMINDTITTGCNASPYFNSAGAVVAAAGGTLPPGPGTAPIITPEPGTFALLLSALVSIGLLMYPKAQPDGRRCRDAAADSSRWLAYPRDLASGGRSGGCRCRRVPIPAVSGQ